MPWVSLKELSEQTSFVTRTLQYIRVQEPGVLIWRQHGKVIQYKQPDCAANLLRRERDLAKKEAKPLSFNDTRARKMDAEAQEAELRVAELLKEVVPREIHQETVGEMADRLRSVLLNLSGNYSVRLEALGIPPVDAERVLEEVALELTTALRAAADDPEASDDESGEALSIASD